MKEFDVFISYSSRNSEIADKICKLLEDKNIECWIAPRDIPMGRKYASIISSAIKSCKIMVLVFSEYAAASPWVESEVAKAFDNKKIIIPFKIEDNKEYNRCRNIRRLINYLDRTSKILFDI